MFRTIGIRLLRGLGIQKGPSYRGIFWIVLVVAYLGLMHFEERSPSIEKARIDGTEYAVAAIAMMVAAGLGRAICDEFRVRWVRGASLLVSAIFLGALGFYLASICLKPGSPFYLLSRPTGQGAALAIGCSLIYGFAAQLDEALRPR